jgi:hypothetical protein
MMSTSEMFQIDLVYRDMMKIVLYVLCWMLELRSWVHTAAIHSFAYDLKLFI